MAGSLRSSCVRVKPIHFNQSNSVCYDTLPLYIFVRTAAMFGISARCGLSSLSARQQDYAQGLHPYRTLQPHMHACSLSRGPTGEPALAHGNGMTDMALL